MIPRRFLRPMLIWCLIFGGSIAGCLCERSSRKFEDFDFDLTPESPDDDSEKETPEAESLR